jgi:hypothetical protein
MGDPEARGGVGRIGVAGLTCFRTAASPLFQLVAL